MIHYYSSAQMDIANWIMIYFGGELYFLVILVQRP